jgi:undecaprenyl diphosphate synthase
MSELQAAAAKPELDIVPDHIAIIMDGNHRWAKARRLPSAAGHRAGTKNVRIIAEACADHGVKHLTLFAFSTENWNRPQREVRLLMDLMRRFLQDDIDELHKNQVRLRVIGDRSRLAPDLKMLIHRAEQLTREHEKLKLNIAVNYGGRWDIVQAAQAIAERVQRGDLRLDDVNEASVARLLSLREVPPPDLCIRTGGEQRISNFLLWDFAYTELYFTETFWPDFSERMLTEAIQAFGARQRRFGRRL